MVTASSKYALLFLAVFLFLSGCSTLTGAVYKGDTKEIERMIAEGADVNEHSGDGLYRDRTPLEVAASKGDIKTARLLIEKGAGVNVKGSTLTSPLQEAARYGHKDIVELLISKGANVNAKNILGYAAIDFAKQGSSNRAIVNLLENEREIAKLKNVDGEPISSAEEERFAEAVRNYRSAAVKPELPEEARKFRIQAEYAFNKKNYEGAAARYKEALAIAPWWPEGHFNRALILAEMSRYRDAIREMNRYLTLVPDAQNVRTAQDNIYRWEGELK